MSELYKKHRILIKLSAILCLLVIIYGTLLIVDDVQKSMRSANSTESVNINEDTGEIPAYNVEGLSDEQIQELLEMERNKRRSE